MRIKLTKSWKHPYKTKPYSIGTVLQVDKELAEKLLKGFAVKYDGEYPPKIKEKINLKQLKTK